MWWLKCDSGGPSGHHSVFMISSFSGEMCVAAPRMHGSISGPELVCPGCMLAVFSNTTGVLSVTFCTVWSQEFGSFTSRIRLFFVLFFNLHLYEIVTFNPLLLRAAGLFWLCDQSSSRCSPFFKLQRQLMCDCRVDFHSADFFPPSLHRLCQILEQFFHIPSEALRDCFLRGGDWEGWEYYWCTVSAYLFFFPFFKNKKYMYVLLSKKVEVILFPHYRKAQCVTFKLIYRQ